MEIREKNEEIARLRRMQRRLAAWQEEAAPPS
jgi:hypothetical protein